MLVSLRLIGLSKTIGATDNSSLITDTGRVKTDFSHDMWAYQFDPLLIPLGGRREPFAVR
ncbi:hypothetical protein OAS62_05215 [Hellea sp.]|nr:hypothetical protein [Hellea sp.]